MKTIMSSFRVVLVLACAAQLGACVTAPIEPYQGSVQNVQSLRAAPGAPLSVGAFSHAPSLQNAASVHIRASIREAPNGSFSEYLKQAIKTELETAGRYRADAPLVIGGVLLENELDAPADFGTCRISAKIAVTNAGRTVYEKTLSQQRRWESSFVGAVAIPMAWQNYAATYQQLLQQLFSDPEFHKAASGR